MVGSEWWVVNGDKPPSQKLRRSGVTNLLRKGLRLRRSYSVGARRSGVKSKLTRPTMRYALCPMPHAPCHKPI